MNIFYTNSNPIVAANEHCRVHMRKMIIEYAQLLSTAHIILDGDTAISGIYKLSHKNHPSAVWVRQSVAHYRWVHRCAMHLCAMYRLDSDKEHKTERVLRNLRTLPKYLPSNGFTEPPCCTSDRLKAANALGKHITECYQEYIIEKHIDWKQRGIDTSFMCVPDWYK